MKNIKNYKNFTSGLIIGLLLIGGTTYATQSGTIGSLFTDIGGGTYRLIGDYIKDGTVGEDELGTNSVTSSKIYNGTITDLDINKSKVQKRVSPCQDGYAIKSINDDGTATCILGADNLGNHTATQDLNMNDNKIINSNKIGIGTVNPTSDLHIKGDGTIKLDGTNNSDYWMFNAYNDGTDLSITRNRTLKTKFRENGDLEVSGNIKENGTNLSDKYLGINTKASDSDNLDGLDSTDFQKRVSTTCPGGESIRIISADGTVTCEVDTDTDTHRIINSANYVTKSNGTNLVDSTIYDNGNVGIGTDNPETDLHIVHDSESDVVNQGLLVESKGVSSVISLKGTNGGAIKYYGEETDLTKTPDFFLKYRPNEKLFFAGNIGKRMFNIESDTGNVGIGTDEPIAPLHIKTSSSSNEYNMSLAVEADGTGGNAVLGLKGPKGGAIKFFDSTQNMRDEPTFSMRYRLETDTFSMGTRDDKRFTILGNGNVGIGTDSPSAKLDVNGTIKSTGRYTQNNDSPTIYMQDTDGRSSMIHTNNNKFYILRGCGTNSTTRCQNSSNKRPLVINLENNNATFGGAVSGVDFLSTSDIRLKKDIYTLDNSLENISKMRGVNFKWKNDNEKEIGLIAQEVEEIYPDLVVTNEEDGMKAVKYSNIVAILIEGMKELYDIVKEDSSRIQKVENENKELKLKLELIDIKIKKLEEKIIDKNTI